MIQGCGKSIFHEVSKTQDARRLGVTVLRVKSDSQKSSKIPKYEQIPMIYLEVMMG